MHCRQCRASRPTIRLPTLVPDPNRPPHCAMTTLEPWAVGDVPPGVVNHTTTTTMLNADIETLTAFKDTVEATLMKGVFESVIGILTLVRVRVLTPLPFSHPLICDVTRTGMKGDAFIELAKDCVRMCHTLKSSTEGNGTDNLAVSVRSESKIYKRVLIQFNPPC